MSDQRRKPFTHHSSLITRHSEIAPWLVSSAVLGLALVLLFYRLGDGSLYDWDEAIYGQVAKEMLLSNTWGTLSWHGYPFFHKPPLYFWLTAFMYQVLGVNEFAVRFWSAASGFGVIGLTFLLGMRWRSWAVGAAAVLLLLVVDAGYYSHWWNFLSLSRVGMLETSLTFWIMVALVLVWEADRRPWLIAFLGLPVGLAVMTKAWPGFFAALIPVVYRLLTRRGRAPRRGYWAIAGVLAGVIMLPWHLWQYWRHGQLFFHEYVSVNLLGRSLQVVEQHTGSPLLYGEALQWGFSIWGYLWPVAYIWIVWQAARQDDRGAWLLLSWITVPLVLFSLAQTKLGWYIAMVYPAVALLMGLALAELLTDRLALGVVAAVMLVCCIRVPTATDGSPEVKRFVPHVREYVPSGATLYVFGEACGTPAPSFTAGMPLMPVGHIRPALVFYMDRPFTCIDERQILAGAYVPQAYAVIDQEAWWRFRHLGRVVFDGGEYILARWH